MLSKNARVSAALLLLMTALMLVGCSRERQLPPSSGLTSQSMSFGGRERTYLLREPSPPAPGQTVALVLVLHGGGASGDQACRQPGTVAAAAHEAGALVVCPDGVDGHWNDGREIENYAAHAEHVNDVGFLLALADRLGRTYPIDTSHLFVSGASNGGMMTLRMACDASERVAAGVAVIANMPADLNCQPTQPVSVLLINGTDDPLMPWDGGQVQFLRRTLGRVISAEATVTFWAEANGCRPDPVEDDLADADPTDGTRVRVERYLDCQDGGRVGLYAVEGGGHTLPGGEQYAPRWLIGRVSHDMDGGQAAWDFFAAAE
jgi:polyhydroxybutyrate depolymerase